jgi:hypothetical protein
MAFRLDVRRDVMLSGREVSGWVGIAGAERKGVA